MPVRLFGFSYNYYSKIYTRNFKNKYIANTESDIIFLKCKNEQLNVILHQVEAISVGELYVLLI